eukprot:4480996-Heterocapsa_arctica.AAC.1
MSASLSQLLRSNNAGVWRFNTYNSQKSGSGSRLYDLTAELRCDVLGLQSTGLRQVQLDETHRCEVKSDSGYAIYQWPWIPTADIAGLDGGLRLRRPGYFDFASFCLYLPNRVKQNSRRQAVCSVWDWILRALPRRTSMMRQVINEHYLVCSNTWMATASGPTYIDGREH